MTDSEGFDAWVIHADFASAALRSTDDEFWPWRNHEVLAVLPASASVAERRAALLAVGQVTHLLGRDRSDVLQFAQPTDYHLGQGDHFSLGHPYLAISRAKNLRHTPGVSEGERGFITFDPVPVSAE